MSVNFTLKMNLLVGSNVVQDTMLKDKAFCESANACAYRRTVGRESKSISLIYIHPFATEGAQCS